MTPATSLVAANAANLPYTSRPYRACVGIMLINDGGQVLVGQRIDNLAEAWQMPQGGIDAGETPEAAALREMAEEIGIGSDKAQLLKTHPHWLDYDIPPDLADQLWQAQYRGQTQKWFAYKFIGNDGDINIATEAAEFSAWRWLAAEELPACAVEFKKPIYQRLLLDFADLLA